MAVSSTHSLTSSLWTNRNIAIAAYKGLHLNRQWERLINFNNQDPQNNPMVFMPVWAAIAITAGLYSTFNHLTKVLSSTKLNLIGNIPDPSGALFYGACTIAALNLTAIVKKHVNKNVADVESPMDKFIIVVWKATPYLMVITNIALTIYDIYNGKIVKIIELGMSAITLLDTTNFVPKTYGWYLDVGIRIPIDAAAMYCYDDPKRLVILTIWALDPQIKATASKWLDKLA